MKKKIVIPVLIVVLLIGTIVTAAYFIDLNRFKPLISQTVKHYTGRELTINGDIRLLKHWPPTLTVEDIAWQNAPWGSRPHMLRVKQAAFAISLTPLLRGEFRFFDIRLQEPAVLLEFNRQGSSNFLLDIPETAGAGAIPVLAFNDISIQNGHFEYNDQQRNASASVLVDDLTADIPGLDKPIQIQFEGSFRELPCSLAGSIGPIIAWIQPGYNLPVDLSAGLGNASARLVGNIQDPVHFKDIALAFTAEGPSTREMALLIDLGTLADLGAFTAKAELTDRPGQLAIDKLDISVGTSDQVSFTVAGNIGDLIDMKGFHLDLGIQTRHTGNLMSMADLPAPPFDVPLSAKVLFSDTAKNQYRFDDLVVRVGGQTIQGRMHLDRTRAHPVLDLQIASAHTPLGPFTLKSRMRGPLDRASVENLEMQLGSDALFKAFVHGAVGSLSPFADLDLSFRILGKELGHLEELVGRPLPVQGPYALSGTLFMADHKALQIPELKIILDNNSIIGSLGMEMAQAHPILRGDFTSSRLNIARLLKPGKLPDNLQKHLSSVGPSRLAFEVSSLYDHPALKNIGVQTRIENLATLSISGAIENLQTFAGTGLYVMVKGNDFKDLQKVVGQDIPLKGPYTISGKLSKPGKQTYHVDELRISDPQNTFGGQSIIQLTDSGTTASLKLATENVSLQALEEGRHAALDRLRSKRDLGPLEIEATAFFSKNGTRLQSLDLTIGKDDFVRMQIGGQVGNLQDLRDIQLDFKISGRNVSDLAPIAGRTIPIEGPYALSGEVAGHAPGNIMLRKLDLALRDNRFTGRADCNLAGKYPLIEAKIAADHFSLAPVTLEEVAPLKGIPDLGPFKLTFTLSEKGGTPAVTQLDFRLGKDGAIVTMLNGTIGSLAPIGDVTLDVEIHSQDLSFLNDAYGSRYIKKIPFQIRGRLHDPRMEKITLTSFQVLYGDSDLSGAATLELTRDRPSLIARLSSHRLDLRPFIQRLDRGGSPPQAPSKSSGKSVFSHEDIDERLVLKRPDQDDTAPQTVGALKKPGKRVFSRKHFNLTPLQKITVNVAVQAEEVLAQRLAFNDVDIHLELKQGNLYVDPLKFRIGGGTAEGSFSLRTENSPPFMVASLVVHHFDIGPMLAQLEQASSLQGMLNTSVHLNSRGDSVAALMAGLNGKVQLDIHDGQVESKHLALLERYLGSNVLDLINPFIKRPRYTTIRCYMSNTTITDGLATFKMVLDTEQTALASAGTIDLKSERLDIGIKPSPKKGFGDANVGYVSFSLSNLSQPFGLGGTLANPQLVLDPTRTVITAAKFAGAAFLGPLGMALFFTDISLGNKNICEEAAQAMRNN